MPLKLIQLGDEPVHYSDNAAVQAALTESEAAVSAIENIFADDDSDECEEEIDPFATQMQPIPEQETGLIDVFGTSNEPEFSPEVSNTPSINAFDSLLDSGDAYRSTRDTCQLAWDNSTKEVSTDNFDTDSVDDLCEELKTDLTVFLAMISSIDTLIKEAQRKNADIFSKYSALINNATSKEALSKVMALQSNDFAQLQSSYKAANEHLGYSASKLKQVNVKVATLISYQKLCPNNSAYASYKKEISSLLEEAHNNIPGGVRGVTIAAMSRYRILQTEWGKLTALNTRLRTLQTEQNANIVASQKRVAIEITHELQSAQQQFADSCFNMYGTNSNLGMYISSKNLSEIAVDAILKHFGGNAAPIYSLGIADDGSLFINDNLFKITNSLTLSDINKAKIPDCYKAQISAGLWGCVFDFRHLSKFYSLRILDLAHAENRKWDALKELCITNGNWGKLFKKYPHLQEIRLPEGTVTRESQSLWSKFKSNSDYAQTKATSQESIGAPRESAPSSSMPKFDIESSIQTFKTATWSKPLPRILIKSMGYGVGVPIYWGIMTALGPFGLLMGALGVGALVHAEAKNFKKNGGA